ncbi:hypothetical protein [Solitalea lacus]|uniref:hypothetical protein n=1 Tax=Solitalea lacus TaxID=2911172 RepID=UPI001EDB5079|nr:hypothetical protein [Solitalea lacus]UKJ07177.1 hypothetical protein L2B55_16820 [Solitalea lacus]
MFKFNPYSQFFVFLFFFVASTSFAATTENKDKGIVYANWPVVHAVSIDSIKNVDRKKGNGKDDEIIDEIKEVPKSRRQAKPIAVNKPIKIKPIKVVKPKPIKLNIRIPR